ncbi:MAG: hypothetical protein SynsKO_35950 [Synoicihabitans sp.]
MDISDRFESFDSELGAAAALFGRVDQDSNGVERSQLFLFYVNGSAEEAITNVVSFTFDATKLALIEGSEVSLIKQRSNSGAHNGGGLLFGADGYLYISLGDGSSGYDLDGNAQSLTKSLLSGIIRIDVYGDDLTKVKPIGRRPDGGETAGYWIPIDNPFVGRENVLEEFWALGLRNPFRMSFMPDGRRLIVGDVGQASYEEINILDSGDNAGWSFREGPLKFRSSRLKGRTPPAAEQIVGPYYWYRNEEERGVVIGGLVLKESLYESENGKYVFSDFRSGEVLSLDLNETGERPVPELLVSKNSPGFGPAYLATSLFLYKGELLVTRLGGGDDGSTILRMRRATELSPRTGVKRKRSGAEIFMAHCASCHGSPDNPSMTGLEAARDFRDLEWQRSVLDSSIRSVIRNGVRNEGNDITMPAWEGILTDEEIESLISVIRTYGE